MGDFNQAGSTQYSIESTSIRSSEVNPVVLDETSTTRRILRSTIVENQQDPKANLTIKLIHERFGKNGFDPIDPPDLRKLRVRECSSCSLNSKETLELYNELSKLYYLAGKFGVQSGNKHYIVLESIEKPVLSDADEKGLSLFLKSCQHTPGLAKKLVEINPEFIERAYHYKLSKKKQDGLARFKVMLEQKCKEQEWQTFFEEHDWIFGATGELQFLAKVVGQPIVAGANVTGLNEKRGDFLLCSQGCIGFISVAEIKKPHTDLLKSTSYRQGVYQTSDELNGGVAQLRQYIKKWQIEGSRTDANKDFLESKGIYTIQPRGFLIIGHLDQIKTDRDKREAFELFRQNQKDIYIVTFDELYHRAQYVLGISQG